MQLYQIASYISEAQTYYNNQSTAFGSFVTPYLNDLQSDYNTYISSVPQETMVQALLGFSSYLFQKYGNIYPTNFPPIPQVYGDYFPNIFTAFNYTLPDYTELFSVTTSGTATVYETTSVYTSLVNTIQNAATTDKTTIQGLGSTIFQALLNVVTYNVYSPDNQIQVNSNFNLKQYLIDNQNVLTVLSTFNQSVLGLNWLLQ